MNFRFQPILNLRKHREENCQIRLRAEQVRLSRIHNEVVAWEERTRRQERIMEEFGTGRIDPTLLEHGSTYLTYVRQKRADARGRELRQEKEVEKARQVLVDASKERKIMDKLKERFAERAYKEYLQKEQKRLDEVGINRVYQEKR
ncbi:MAG TPA: flagellar export protein FliJ [Firmicutes bacterium]|nr:flagellar export protein FliJ [Bacillota bacterium]